MSPHSGADGLVQGELPPISPECWPFSPALPVTLAHPLLPPKHRWLSGRDKVRTVVPVPRGDHLPFLGSPALTPSRLTGDIATPTRRYHGRMLIHPFLPACANPSPKRFAHAQVRVPRESTATCFGHALWNPISLAIQIRSCSSEYVNVFQWNREWFFSRRVKSDSGFNVMAVYEVSCHRQEIIHHFTGIWKRVLTWWKRPFWFSKKIYVTLSSNWVFPNQGGCSQFLISFQERLIFVHLRLEKEFFHFLWEIWLPFALSLFRVDFWCVHRFQLLNVCNQYVSLPNSPPRTKRIQGTTQAKPPPKPMDSRLVPRSRQGNTQPMNQTEWLGPLNGCSKTSFIGSLPITQEICEYFADRCSIPKNLPTIFFQIWLQQYCRGTFFHSAHCSLSNPICLRSVWCRRTMIPGKIFTSFSRFQGIVSVNDFRLSSRLQELLQVPLCLLRSFCFARMRLGPLGGHVLHRDCISMIVSRFDNLSLRTLWSAVIKSPKLYSSRYGSANASSARGPCTYGPLTDLAISVFKGNEYQHFVYPNPHVLASIGSKDDSWEELACDSIIHEICSEFLQPFRPVRNLTGLTSLHSDLRFYLVWDFWLPWSTSLAVLSFQHVYLTQILETNLSHTGLPVGQSHHRLRVMVGEEDELEEDAGWSISSLEGVMVACWRGKTGGRTRWQTRNLDRNEILRVSLYPISVISEMAFLTVDPFIRVSVFIAKLSER